MSGAKPFPAALPDFTESPLDSTLVHQGGFLTLRKDTVRLPDGSTATREYLRHPGAAMMIPFLDDATLLLEHQFRYPAGRHFIELPAGKIDTGETPLAAAKRELVEECGYEAAQWRHLGTTYPCIGYSDERIEIFAARDLTAVGHARDPGEFLELVPVALDEALAWVRDGRITDGKTIIGLLWADKLAGAAPGW
ncbi:MAG: NUDIX domain-containing protein [Burkholderiales bacterium]